MAVNAAWSKRPLHDEDAVLFAPDLGLFAVFDGLGGEYGGRQAARLARRIVASYCRSHASARSLETLAHAVIHANEVVGKSPRAGFTTAVAVWIGGNVAHWVSVGDSRIYHQIGFEPLRMLSRDEGYDNIVDNYLGDRFTFKGVRQRQTITLRQRDTLLLVSDGITGDFKPDLLSPTDIATAIRDREPQDAADNLVEVARKHDDRTAIVIKIE